MLSVWSSVLQIQRTGGNEIGSRTSDFEKRQVLRRAELKKRRRAAENEMDLAGASRKGKQAQGGGGTGEAPGGV